MFLLCKDKASEALDLFDELVEIEIGIIIPYVKALVELCLQVNMPFQYSATIFVDACCTIISININEYSKVNCTLNRV